MKQGQLSRRSVLHWSGIIAGSSLAGCIGEVPLGNGGYSAGAYRSWLVDPALLDQDNYPVAFTSPSSAAEYSSALRREDWENYLRFAVDRFEFTRFLPEDLNQVINAFPNFSIAAGDFDIERLESDLRQNDFTPRREYEGYEIYLRSDERQAVGVSDNHIVFAYPPDPDPARVVRFIVDTNAGDERRYHEVDSDFETLTDTMTRGDILFSTSRDRGEETDVENGKFRNSVAAGASYSLGDEETNVTFTLVFVDERDVVERDIEEWTRRGDNVSVLRDIDISVNGRVATVEGVVLTRDVSEVLTF